VYMLGGYGVKSDEHLEGCIFMIVCNGSMHSEYLISDHAMMMTTIAPAKECHDPRHDSKQKRQGIIPIQETPHNTANAEMPMRHRNAKTNTSR
jgi:hypothetical protein